MIFPEALATLEEYRTLTSAIDVPVLANITEFGQTPLFTREQLAGVGIGIALYPLSAFRAANAAALQVYRVIRDQGTQREVLNEMQTREELYDLLGYEDLEQRDREYFGEEPTT